MLFSVHFAVGAKVYAHEMVLVSYDQFKTVIHCNYFKTSSIMYSCENVCHDVFAH